MAKFDSVQGSLQALNERVRTLLDDVRTQHAQLASAQAEAAAYPPRASYFAQLQAGAEAMVQLHDGYARLQPSLQELQHTFRACTEQAMQIHDQRERERASLRAGGRPSHAAPSYPGLLGLFGGASGAGGAGGAAVPMPQPKPQPRPPQPQPPQPQPPPPQPHPQPPPPYAQASAYPSSLPPSNGAQAHRPAAAVARPLAAPIVQPSPRPSMIQCYGCRQKFGVPPNATIVGCPFCSQHNRVPGA